LLARFRPVLNEHGITGEQYRVMRAIQAGGLLEPRQIGGARRLWPPMGCGTARRIGRRAQSGRESCVGVIASRVAIWVTARMQQRTVNGLEAASAAGAATKTESFSG
jgi:hypothetical protein